MKLTEENFREWLEHRWKLVPINDLRELTAFTFEIFLYVCNETAPSNFHRATASRIERARTQRAAYQAANQVSFGTITAQHLDITNARRPDDADYIVPTDNTSQAMELDRMRTEEEAKEEEGRARSEAATATVRVKLNNSWMRTEWMHVEVDILSLRRALGLPDHSLFSRGIFHDFQPVPPSQPTLQDVDHTIDHEENNASQFVGNV